jgi:hypothetical protein
MRKPKNISILLSPQHRDTLLQEIKKQQSRDVQLIYERDGRRAFLGTEAKIPVGTICRR